MRREDITAEFMIGMAVIVVLILFVYIPADLLYEAYGWVGAVSVPVFFIVAYPVGKVVLWIREVVSDG